MTMESFSKHSSNILGIYLVLVVCTVLHSVSGQRSNDKIYQKIQASNPCFKRLNGTQEIGCSSSSSGDVGVLYLVNDADSLLWVTSKGPHSPYIPAVYPQYFNQDVMTQFQRSGRVAGVVLLNNTKSQAIDKFSTDEKCPNQQFSFYKNDSKTCDWNNDGTGLLFENFKFPIFLVHDEENVTEIVNCYEKFNKPSADGSPKDWPLCAIQLQAFMSAAVNTPTCLRRSNPIFSLSPNGAKVCDPLGDLNIWAPLLPTNQSEPYSYDSDGSVIVIGAKLDAGSMFDMLAPGADSAASGIVTLLMVLKQLSELKNSLLQDGKIKNVYFMLFNGESFGYIGSSRIVYDMKRGMFPDGIGKDDQNVPSKLNLTDIKYFIEIGQVALNSENENYYIHQSNPSSTFSLTKTLIEKGGELTLTLQNVSQSSRGLPPASFQSFLKERPSIPGIVITNHETVFRNKFYNSIFDDAAQIKYKYKQFSSSASVQSKISKLAAAVSNTVLKLMETTDAGPKVKPDPELVDELLHCFLETADCPLFRSIRKSNTLPAVPWDLYVGVHQHYKPITIYTKYLMISFQGTNITNITKEEDCKTTLKTVYYYWQNESCFESTVNVSEALSPAFLIDNYDWSSGEYSTWTESVWQKFSVRIFLKPSRLHEILTLVSGIFVFALSLLVVGWVNSKADIIFPNRPAALAC